MIGYDVGARLDPDDAGSGSSGGDVAQTSEISGILQSMDAFMGAMPEMVVRMSGNAAELDAVTNVAADLTARKTDAGSGGLDADAMLADERPLFARGTSDHFGDVQQLLLADKQAGENAPFEDSEAAPIYMHANPDVVGGIVSFGNQIQQATADSGNGLPSVDVVAEANESSRGYYDIPENINLAGRQGGDEDAYPHASLDSDSDGEFQPAHSFVENFNALNSRASSDPENIDRPKPFYDSYEKIVAGEGRGDQDMLGPKASAGRGPGEFDDAETESAGIFGTVEGANAYEANLPLASGKDETTHDQAKSGFGHLFSETWTGNDVLKKNEASGVEVADADTNEPFFLVAALGAEDAKRMEFSDKADHTESLEDGGSAVFAGLWEMLRNAERVFPERSAAMRREGDDAALEVRERTVGGEPSALARLLAGNEDRDQKTSRMPDEKIIPGVGRNGPTGHKNDPIYTIAISQAPGTLMPVVPTSGVSTRSPPIPGQRNLP